MTLDRDFWLSIRHAYLMQVGAIEKILGINPTTAEVRKWARVKYGDCGTIKADDVKVKIAEIETK
jgi:hypothetical protein